MLTKAPKGTRDMLPAEAHKWHFIEGTIRELTAHFGYKEVRTPIFEHTELFERGVGGTTDIVQKEMYTFLDKGGRSITLKPEGTAGVVRAYIENKLYADIQPQKVYYITPVFRYERPQSGRLREHHQFGVEVFGAGEPSVDAEIIVLAMTLFSRLNIRGLELNINSIGCHNCRPAYHESLKDYLKTHINMLCETCNTRFDKNPLRILDCKTGECREIVKGAPLILDFLCDECRAHFEALQDYLSAAGLQYSINPLIVRGLDYYTKTVFEIISTDIGAQGTVCGGGRYDGLVAECGGPDTPGAGFGLGLERLLMVLEKQDLLSQEEKGCEVFIATIGNESRMKAFELITQLRSAGLYADLDHAGRSIKAQFKFADKINALRVCIIGEDELQNGTVTVKEMATGTQETVPIDRIVDYLKNVKERKK